MKLVILAAIFLICVSAVQCRAADIPFTIEKGYIVVPAKVGKDRSVEVILATGRDMSVVDVATLYKIGITPNFSNDPTSISGKPMIFARVKEIAIGESKPVSLNMLGSELSGISKSIGRDIFAILGADFFKGLVVRFDFGKKVVSVLDAFPAESTPIPTAQPRSAFARSIFKMDTSRTTKLGVQVTLPVTEENLYNEIAIKTLFDTGVADPFSITPGAAKTLGLSTIAEKGKPAPTKLNTVRVSNMEFKEAPAIVYGKEAGLDVDQKEYGVVAGLALLQNFVVTFDFKEKRIAFEAIPTK